MKIRLAFFIFLAIALIPVLSYANALYPVSLQEKVKKSSLIVEGEVVDQYSFWNPAHTLIYTASKVAVYKVFAGNVSTSYIQVLTEGGSVGNQFIYASDLLSLSKGDIGTFFCFPNEIALREPKNGELLLDVYSSAQGCYKYNTVKMSAAEPLEKFSSITGELYPAITNVTGRAVKDLNASKRFSKADAPVTQMGVIDYNPKLVTAGTLLTPATNLLTITGSGFGVAGGATAAVLFDNPDDGTGGTPLTVLSTSSLIVSWSDTEIKIKVPGKAGTGAFSVRNSDGTVYSSGSALQVLYAVLTFNVGGTDFPIALADINGSGGYDIKYSSSTLGNGRNLNTALEKAPVQRALNTWKEVAGYNLSETGTSSLQKIDPNDGTNIFVLDNTNTGKSPMASGVLAVTYFGGIGCSSGGVFSNPLLIGGFDVLIRNTGVSTGNVNFTLGPCPPSTAVTQIDLETVVLHELGHSFGLGHVNDNYEGQFLPYINPPKIMNFSIPNGIKRTSPDFSAFSGANYMMTPKGWDFGGCGVSEHQPLASLVDTKDECPATFPVTTTQNNTSVAFDLVHATSNKFGDPAYDDITCDGNGTEVTNNAYYVIKTGVGTGGLDITVSGFNTQPAAQQACTRTGVQLALYRANSKPEGQNFPQPFDCRLFNGNLQLASITGLEKNATYIVYVNGLNNTKATFTLNFAGAVLASGVTYVFNGNGNWTVASNWQNNLVPPQILPAGSSIFINPSTDGTCILNRQQTIQTGASLTVNQNKSFIIQGNLSVQ